MDLARIWSLLKVIVRNIIIFENNLGFKAYNSNPSGKIFADFIVNLSWS